MATAPHVLLDTSIAQLQILAAFLSEEMRESPAEVSGAAQTRACKEILLTLRVLIPKLQAARYIVAADPPTPGRRCRGCEEN
ncbi:MAG: hypothetical protein JOZ12_08380 [Sinobacteraceae bacterium]|nr:hypothetical protein [Nevskiaceae bacterium]